MKADETIYCPYCHKHTALILADGMNYGDERSGSSMVDTTRGRWWIGICNSCDNAVLVNQSFDRIIGRWKTVRISPDPLPKPIDDRIPDFIKNDILEAHKCFSIGAYRATAMLCRRILQTICLEKGAKDDDLYKQIDELLTKGIITKDIQEWAHSVRWVGNNAAHPSLKGDIVIEEEDAEDILDLVDKTVYVLYIAGTIAREKKEKFQKKPKSP